MQGWRFGIGFGFGIWNLGFEILKVRKFGLERRRFGKVAFEWLGEFLAMGVG